MHENWKKSYGLNHDRVKKVKEKKRMKQRMKYLGVKYLGVMWRSIICIGRKMFVFEFCVLLW